MDLSYLADSTIADDNGSEAMSDPMASRTDDDDAFDHGADGTMTLILKACYRWQTRIMPSIMALRAVDHIDCYNAVHTVI